MNRKSIERKKKTIKDIEASDEGPELNAEDF